MNWIKKLEAGGATALALALGVAGIFLLRSHVKAVRADVATPVQAPWALHVLKLRKGTVSEGFPALATLSTQDEISIKPQIGGVIGVIGPRAGRKVKKGDLLVRIDTTEIENNLAALRASLNSAKAKLKLAQIELARTKRLVIKGYATPEQRDQKQATLRQGRGLVDQLEAQIKAAKTRIAYGTIRSPVNGSIIVRNQTKGDLATPGKEIYRLNASGGAKVKISVPQEVLAHVHPGGSVFLTYGNKQQTIKLTRISPSLDSLSMGTVEADLAQIPFGLPSGARVQARVVLDSKNNVLIAPLPTLAIAADDQTAIVFRVGARDKDGLAKLQKLQVKLISRGAEGVAISGNLQAGDELVSAHQSVLLRLRDGELIRPYELAAGG